MMSIIQKVYNASLAVITSIVTIFALYIGLCFPHNSAFTTLSYVLIAALSAVITFGNIDILIGKVPVSLLEPSDKITIGLFFIVILITALFFEIQYLSIATNWVYIIYNYAFTASIILFIINTVYKIIDAAIERYHEIQEEC